MEQLALKLPVEHANSDSYKDALAEYLVESKKRTNAILFYCSQSKKFSVNLFCVTRDMILRQPTFKIILPEEK